jgi:hypothetical protein
MKICEKWTSGEPFRDETFKCDKYVNLILLHMSTIHFVQSYKYCSWLKMSKNGLDLTRFHVTWRLNAMKYAACEHEMNFQPFGQCLCLQQTLKPRQSLLMMEAKTVSERIKSIPLQIFSAYKEGTHKAMERSLKWSTIAENEKRNLWKWNK